MHLRSLIACTLVLAMAGSVTAQKKTSSSAKQRARAHTGESEAEFNKAVRAAQNKDFATAEPLLKKAVQDNPKNYQAFFYLG
ncbi:MAG TPA: hypothetical protein VF135_08345, partial [Terriglobales bacterium]